MPEMDITRTEAQECVSSATVVAQIRRNPDAVVANLTVE
jgi:hypothetical protein